MPLRCGVHRRQASGRQVLNAVVLCWLAASLPVTESTGGDFSAFQVIPLEFNAPFPGNADQSLVRQEVANAMSAAALQRRFEKAASVFIKAANILIPRTDLDRQARQFGLCGLRNLAQNPDIRWAMWNNKPARTSLINGAKLGSVNPSNKQASECSLEALAFLALEPLNRRPMWRDRCLKKVVIDRAADKKPMISQWALAVLRNLAVDEKVAINMWLDKFHAREVLLDGAEPILTSNATQNVTRNALQALANLANVVCIRQPMWINKRVQEYTYKAIRFTTEIGYNLKAEIRIAGLEVLRGLSRDRKNAPTIWKSKTMFWIALASIIDQKTILQGQESNLKVMMKSRYPIIRTSPKKGINVATVEALYTNLNCTEVNIAALECFASLAQEKTVQQEMWEEPFIKEVTFAWAQVAECGLCRQWALKTQINLARNNQLRSDMWDDGQAGSAGQLFVNTTANQQCDEGGPTVRFLGYEGLWELAGGTQTKISIWNNAPANGAIQDGIRLSYMTSSLVQSVAYGVLWRLTTMPEVADFAWHTPTVRNNVAQAAEVMIAVGDILIRQFAFAILYQWSDPWLQFGLDMWKDLTIRRAVLSISTKTDIWYKQCQLFGLAIMWNWAHGPQAGFNMFQDRLSARAVLIRVARDIREMQMDAQAQAMCTLEVLSKHVLLQELMWGDLETRTTLNRGALQYQNPRSQECALAALVHLATNIAIRHEMWLAPYTREALLYTAGNNNPFIPQPRRLGVAGLQTLALAGLNRQQMWFSAAGPVIIKKAEKTPLTLICKFERETRARAIATLRNWAANSIVSQHMWKDKFGAMCVILAAAKDTNSNNIDARVYAFATLSRLAENRLNRVPMWYDLKLREIVIKGSFFMAGYQDSRAGAMATIWQWSFDPQLKCILWLNKKVRASLDGAISEQPPDQKVQNYALYTMRNLAEATCNQKCMWEEEKESLISAAGQTLGTRTFGMSVLQMLAFSMQNSREMWLNADCKTVVIDASQLQSPLVVSNPDFRSRQYAFATFQLWSRPPASRRTMFHETRVQQSLLWGCVAAWSYKGVGTYARTFAITTLQFLATSPRQNKKDMWLKTTDIRDQCLIPNSKLPPSMPTTQWTSADVSSDSGDAVIPSGFYDLASTDDMEGIVKVAGRLSALATITSLCEEEQIRQDIWTQTSPSAVASLIDAAEVTDASYNFFKAVGLQGLANLAMDPTLKEDIWKDEDIREAFISSAKLHAQYGVSAQEANQWSNCGILHAVRQSAMSGLANLAGSNPQLQIEMWADTGVVDGFLVGAHVEDTCFQDTQAKAEAMRGFAGLASADENREAMWRNTDVRAVLMAIAQDRRVKNQEARKYAILALQELADAAGNQRTMWGGVGAMAVSPSRRRTSRRLSAPTTARNA